MSALAVLQPKWRCTPTRTNAQWQLISYGKPLSRRQVTVALMIAGGLTRFQIAKELGIATKTVGTHRERAMERLRVDSDVMLAYLLEARGKIQNPFSGEPNG